MGGYLRTQNKTGILFPLCFILSLYSGLLQSLLCEKTQVNLLLEENSHKNSIPYPLSFSAQRRDQGLQRGQAVAKHTSVRYSKHKCRHLDQHKQRCILANTWKFTNQEKFCKVSAGYKTGKFSIPGTKCSDAQTAKGAVSSNSVRLNVMQSSRLQKHQIK